MQFVKQTLLFCCVFLWDDIQAIVYESPVKSFVKNYNHHRNDITVHKVSFTQKGYIQFLRYIVDVPPLPDYTFCIWVRSNNLTYSQPLLSYSKHEEERLIRVWISPFGTHLNLEILEYPVFKIPIRFVENHWYHICQSWSSTQATWTLFFNGRFKTSGYVPQLRGIVIKGGGDIVVGQEYTDFDKGLDDGIEGDVFGFNFVLSSPTSLYYPLRRRVISRRPGVDTRYFPMQPPNRKLKGFSNAFNMFDDRPAIRVHPGGGGKVFNDIEDFTPKTTGLRLVELSYNCFLGRGAPVSGREVLISWTKTPVRVFGGAIMKNIKPFCT